MKRLFAALALALLLPLSVHAENIQYGPPAAGGGSAPCNAFGSTAGKCLEGNGDASNTTSQATGGNTALTAANRAAFTYNIKDYGAVCNDTGDDGPAINLAIAALRTAQRGILTGPSGVKCRHTTTINMTALNPSSVGNRGTIIDIGGVQLDCNVTGGVCVDAIDSKFLYVKSLQILGNSANEPAIGFQYGDRSPNVTAADFQFFAPMINGSFTRAARINFGSEASTTWGGTLSNADNAASGAFVDVVDCYNHWGLTSAYATISWSADTPTSCDSIANYGTHVQQTGSGGSPALWLGGTSQYQFDRQGYTSTNGPNVVVIYNESSQVSSAINLLQHMETYQTLQCAILISGSVAAPVINGLGFEEFNAQSAFAQVCPDFAGGVTGGTINALRGAVYGVNTNVASTYAVFGKYSVVTAATVATGGSGCTNGAQTFTVSGGLGNSATLTGTVTANALAGALVVAISGAYQTVPASPATVTGGGCAVAPTVTLTTAATAGIPMTLNGIMTVVPSGAWQSPPAASFSSLITQLGSGGSAATRFNGAGFLMSNLASSSSTDQPVCAAAGTGTLTKGTGTCGSGAPRIICQSGAAAAFTGGTSETNLAACKIPAGILGANGAVRVSALYSMTNNANAKSLIIRHSSVSGDTTGSAYFNLSVPNLGFADIQKTIRNANAVGAQVGAGAGPVGPATGAGATVTGTIGTNAADSFINFNQQLGTGTDTVTLLGYTVEALLP